MNFTKLDTALILALQNNIIDPSLPSIVVFVHTESVLDTAAIAVLEGFGISEIALDNNVYTATLSLDAISQLSEQPWVQYLKLSQKLRLASGD